MQTICTAMKKCVTERVNKNFNNGFVQLADLLDPRIPNDGDHSFLIANIEAYFTDCKVQCKQEELMRELQAFSLRTTAERLMDHEQYWFAGTRRLSSALCSKFVEMVLQALLTEASVERTYKSQKYLFKPDRNRSNDKTLNAQMMVKCNFKAVTSPLTKKKEKVVTSTELKTNSIRRHDWEIVALQLALPEHNPDLQMTTRRKAKTTDALSLTLGNRVRIAWEEPNKSEKTWFDAVIVGVEDRGKYRVVYSGEKKVRDFDPLGKDGEWTLHAE